MEIIGQNYRDDQISIFIIFLFFLFIYIIGKNEKTRNLLNSLVRNKIEVFTVFRSDDTLGHRFIKKPIAM